MTGDADTRVAVRGEHDVSRAILYANRISRAARFQPADQSRIATTVSELARNILKYAGHGEIELREIADGARTGVEIIAGDNGPGIDDCSLITDHGKDFSYILYPNMNHGWRDEDTGQMYPVLYDALNWVNEKFWN